MPLFQFSQRDIPATGSESVEALKRSRLPFFIFLVTHGLRLATSLAGLMFAVSDAHPEPWTIVAVSQALEPR